MHKTLSKSHFLKTRTLCLVFSYILSMFDQRVVLSSLIRKEPEQFQWRKNVSIATSVYESLLV